MNSDLNILHWNVNGYNTNVAFKLQLQILIDRHDLDFLSLTESHTTTFSIHPYQHISCSPDLNIYIKQGLAFEILHNSNIGNICEFCVILSKGIVYIFAYLRNGKDSLGISHLIEIILELRSSFTQIVVIGDLNAKLLSLGNRKSNAAGSILSTFLDSYDEFIILNEPGISTFHRPHPYLGSVSSTIDLCLITEPLLGVVTLNVLESEVLSDHRPLFLQLASSKKSMDVSRLYQALYPLRSQNLHLRSIPPEFGEMVDSYLMEKLPFSLIQTSPGEAWECMKTAFYKSLKELDVLKIRRAQKSSFKLPQNLLDLRLTDRHLFRIEARKFLSQKWSSFIESINSEMESRTLWAKFKRSRGSKPVSLSYGDPQLEVNKIKDKFMLASQPSFVISNEELLHTSSLEDYNVDWNRKIELHELTFALTTLGSSSPGSDGISYNILKALGLFSKNMLCDILNQLFESSCIPENMKQCLQIALPKSGGDFRPITLLNAIIKLYEKVLYNRLQDFIDTLLPASQFGFRKQTSSSDQASNLIMNIQSARSRKNHVAVLFIDIKKAFDRVHRTILLNDLHRSGVRGKILFALRSLLFGNKIRIFFQDAISEEYETAYGCPQGSILSPLLWNFFFRKYDDQITSCSKFGFADDLAILSEHPNAKQCYHQLTADFSRLNSWTRTQGIEISMAKTNLVDYSLAYRKKFSTDLHVLYKDPDTYKTLRITRTSSYRYLGVILDENLSWKPWINAISIEMETRMRTIQKLSRTMKLSRQKCELFYTSYVRGYMNYGSSIWACIPEKVQEKIHIMDRKGLRIVTGALPKTPNSDLYSESPLIDSMSLGLRSIAKQGIRCFFNVQLAPLYQTVITLHCSSLLAQKWMESWSHYDIPRAPNIETSLRRVDVSFQKPVRFYNLYHGDFWIERTLARFRMQVIPTREWAMSVKLTDNALCRHCQLDIESSEHLLNYCTELDYSSLYGLFEYCSFPFEQLTLNILSGLLQNSRTVIRQTTETALILFIKSNSLFRRI
jgi:hypothetical protein